MPRVVSYLLLAIVLFVAYDKGWPWLQQRFGDNDAASRGDRDDRATQCVERAERANETFGESIGRVGNPGGDPGAWADFHDRVSNLIDVAEDACGCSQAACEKAGEAMELLRANLGDYDDRIQGISGMSGNPVRRQLDIDSLLGDARRLAGAGE